MEEIDEATHKRRRFGDMNARIQEKIALKTHSSPCTNALNIPSILINAQSYTPHRINISIQTHLWMRILIRGIYGLRSVRYAETGAWKGENTAFLKYERNRNAE